MGRVNSILLIDDDQINNFVNERLIRKLGLSSKINVATSGSEAIQHVEKTGENCPNLIFLDLNMPAIDGFEFLEIFQKMEFPNKNKVVIVILTTSTNLKDMERIKNYGNFEFVNKPLKDEKLLEIVEKYFRTADVISDIR